LSEQRTPARTELAPPCTERKLAESQAEKKNATGSDW